MAKFYVTTAIDYPSSKPHLGHAYEKTIADAMARWNRLKGNDVFFLTGTDEHGMKIQRAAEREGKSPKLFVDEKAALFKELCEKWRISYDRFIRTTDDDHENVCQDVFQKVLSKGDIYLGEYSGLYCTDCERFYLEKDLQAGNICPVHGKKVDEIKEPSYFFRMGKYRERLLAHFEKNPEFIYPTARRMEILNRVKEGLNDLSVSRASFTWGIPLPNDKNHVIYVWFDALLNYVSGAGYGSSEFKRLWPADVQNIGKDILWFHSVIWPCMLFSAGIEPPKKVCVHGFINAASGEKMSKSLGNVVDPIELANSFGSDSLRYFLLREIPFGEDGSFSEESLAKRHNDELANELGNLVFRVLSLIEKKSGGLIPNAKADPALFNKLNLVEIEKHMDSFSFNLALSEIFSFVAECNRYVNAKEPWKQSGKELEETLYTLADGIRVIAILVSPFMPSTAQSIAEQFGFSFSSLKECRPNLLKQGTKVKPSGILFVKIEIAEKKEERSEKEVELTVEAPVAESGFKIKAAIVHGVKVKKKHEGLEKLKKETLSGVDLVELERSAKVKGYAEICRSLGVKGNVRHAMENLIEITRTAGKIPTINTVVDSYNVVSIAKGIVGGAHDLDKITGNVKIRLAHGNEQYIPIGSTEPKPPEKGEYIFVDDSVVLCRLDVKQGIHTMIDDCTKNILVYVQGNRHISDDELDLALKEILANIQRFCGGKERDVKVGYE